MLIISYIQVKERISRVVQTFVDNGARLILDGRKVMVCVQLFFSTLPIFCGFGGLHKR